MKGLSAKSERLFTHVTKTHKPTQNRQIGKQKTIKDFHFQMFGNLCLTADGSNGKIPLIFQRPFFTKLRGLKLKCHNTVWDFTCKQFSRFIVRLYNAKQDGLP